MAAASQQQQNATLQAANALEDFLKSSAAPSVASSSAKGAGDGNSSVHSTMMGVAAAKNMVKTETNNHQSVNNQTTKSAMPVPDKVNSL